MTKAKAQRSEAEAWMRSAKATLGAHPHLGHARAERIAAQIVNRYPSLDDEAARDAAVAAAYEVLVADNPESVVAGMGDELGRARSLQRMALVRIEQAASMLVEPPESKPKGVRSQSGFARAAGVDRMTVLKWLGLR